MNERMDDPFRPVVLTIEDSENSAAGILPLSREERYRLLPTPSLQDYLSMDVLGPEARAAALAELARRGVPPPTA